MTIDKAQLKALVGQGSLPPVVADLLAEIERLREDPHMRAIRSLRGDCADLMDERDHLKAENQALRKDAERYRWITENADVDCRGHEMGREYGSLDECIDAAMAKEASHG